METFNNFEEKIPGKSFNEVIEHAFKNYYKILGWSILLFVIYIALTLLLSAVLNPLVGYNPLEAQSEMEKIMREKSSFSTVIDRIFAIPGYKESIGVSYLTSLLLIPLFVGTTYMMHKVNMSRAVKFSDLFMGYRKNTIQYIIFAILMGIFVSFGLLLCGVGIFFVIPLMFFGIPLILFENNNAFNAFGNSIKIASKDYLTLLFISLVSILVAFGGVMFCGIGILATFPFYYAVMYSAYVAYRKLPL